ncbi:transposase [Streptomyces sp. NPDC059802]|uniref:transposase n=1 Tax=Streptomyces sp. NPDC059802 TaxID=3346952 RepID=UPI003665A399
MGSKKRAYDAEFREGAVRIVIETGKPIPQVADELGVHAGTLHGWVSRWRRKGSASSDRPPPVGPRRRPPAGGCGRASGANWSGCGGR